ncbi:chemotaxis protein CheC [Megalodesulfovibrio paquesii]
MPSPDPSTCAGSSCHASEMQLDLLRELINVGIGRAAAAINQLTNSHVILSIPRVQVLRVAEVLAEAEGMVEGHVSVVELGFDGLFTGSAVLIFAPNEATRLVEILLGDTPSPEEIHLMHAGTLQEVGNLVLNAVMGSIANILGDSFTYLPPDHFETPFADLLLHDATEASVILIARTSFILENHVVEGTVLVIFKQGSFTALLEAVDATLRAAGMLDHA